MAKKALVNKANEKPKFAVRGYTRCQKCGRPRAVYRTFGLCRVCFRDMAHAGELPGVLPEHGHGLGRFDGGDPAGPGAQQHHDDAAGAAADVGHPRPGELPDVEQRPEDVREKLQGAIVAGVPRIPLPLGPEILDGLSRGVPGVLLHAAFPLSPALGPCPRRRGVRGDARRC